MSVSGRSDMCILQDCIDGERIFSLEPSNKNNLCPRGALQFIKKLTGKPSGRGELFVW